MFYVKLILLLFTFHISFSYKYLVVFPLPGKSHTILGNGYVQNLLNAGHEVTYITPLPMKNTNPKLRQIDVSSNFNIFPEDMLNVSKIMTEEAMTNNNLFIAYIMLDVAKTSLLHENVQALLNDPSQKFDAVIAEWLFSNIYTGLSAVYDCPFIWSYPNEPNSLFLSLIGENGNPAYTPSAKSSNTPPLTFKQRVNELLQYIMDQFILLVIYPFEIKAYNTVYEPLLEKRGKPFVPFSNVRYNISMILGNSNPPLSPAIRLPQNYKEIGGYHIDGHVKPLPEDLKEIMDNAKNGVIYFSLGSTVKSKDLPDKLKADLLEVFGQLDQVVLWKFEEVLPKIPKNVHILKWAPQPSILNHPNCVLFITHGGLLSTTETVYYGVPAIGIPIFADQFSNVKKAVNKGFAKQVDLKIDMAKPLKSTIQEMVSNKSYRDKVKELSSIYHDRLVSPGAELVHWAEHVVRTRGAPHLRSPALSLACYQKMYLDLAAILIALGLAIRFVLKKVCRRNKCVSKDKKNK